MAEFALIDTIAAMFPEQRGVRMSIGDDAAWLDPGRWTLVSTDTLVEGVHFRLDWSTPEDVGWKTLATNLSDIAAMGGRPGVWFSNLTIPRAGAHSALPEIERGVARLLDGMRQAVDALVPSDWPLTLAGGDVTSTSGPLVLSVTIMGEAPRRGEGASPVLRSGARARDHLVLFGHVGLAAAGLAALEGGLRTFAPPHDDALLRPLLDAHRRPRPHLALAWALGCGGHVTAMIDVSDGVLQDVGHLARRSEARVRVDAAALPLPVTPWQVGSSEAPTRETPLALALTGGDDYALAACVSPEQLAQVRALASAFDVPCTVCGEVVAQGPGVVSGVEVVDARGAPLQFTRRGYQHPSRL